MEQKINIAELLKDCPKGMELDCTMYDSVTLLSVDDREDICFPIRVIREDGNSMALTKYGQYTDANFAKCVIFPKGKTTWEGFVPPCKFKEGDVVVTTLGNIAIIRKPIGKELFYVYVLMVGNSFYKDENPKVSVERFASEEEKQKLFEAIKANGYKWNAETKTLEKLVEPKFKVGDRVRHCRVEGSSIYKVVKIEKSKYVVRKDTREYDYHIDFEVQDDWELVPNKFDITTLKPFESRVLVRHNRDNKWCGSFFSHIDEDFNSHCYKFVTTAGKSYPMCIPYKDNQHLLGTTDDCDDFYKTWE